MEGILNFITGKVLPAAFDLVTSVGMKLLIAVLIFVVGFFIIKAIVKFVKKSPKLEKMDSGVRSFTASFLSIALYIVLFVTIAAVVGIPIASLLTVLASCGVAIGLALQGALSNFAGGIMILIFRPFGIGDYVSAAGAEGSVKEITVFYTKIITVDNKLITVPNGALMNANVTNFSSEPTRRVDIPVTVAYGTDAAVVTDIMLAAAADPRVIAEPAPVVVQTNSTDNGREITLRVWVNNADYWDVRFDVTERVFAGLAEKGIKPATARVSVVAEGK